MNDEQKAFYSAALESLKSFKTQIGENVIRAENFEGAVVPGESPEPAIFAGQLNTVQAKLRTAIEELEIAMKQVEEALAQ